MHGLGLRRTIIHKGAVIVLVLTSEQWEDETLEAARKTYGARNQILVSIEELNELACVLAKYPRYDSEEKARAELYEKALDEVADVEIILKHVKAILGIDSEDLSRRKTSKIERLNRWLYKSKSMQVTIEDRIIVEE